MEILMMLNIYMLLLIAKETQLSLELALLDQTAKSDYINSLLIILTFTKLQPK